MTIELRHLQFFAYHGIFPGEKNIGSSFEVNVSVTYSPGKNLITDIEDTINYVRLYEIVKARMAIPTNLLETVAMEIAETIRQEFPFARNAAISIYKLNPPIENFQGQVGISYQKDF